MTTCDGCERLRERLKEALKVIADQQIEISRLRPAWQREVVFGTHPSLTKCVGKDTISGINTGLSEPQGGMI